MLLQYKRHIPLVSDELSDGVENAELVQASKKSP